MALYQSFNLRNPLTGVRVRAPRLIVEVEGLDHPGHKRNSHFRSPVAEVRVYTEARSQLF